MSPSPNSCSKKIFLDQVAQGLVQLSIGLKVESHPQRTGSSQHLWTACSSI